MTWCVDWIKVQFVHVFVKKIDSRLKKHYSQTFSPFFFDKYKSYRIQNGNVHLNGNVRSNGHDSKRKQDPVNLIGFNVVFISLQKWINKKVPPSIF